MQTVNVSAYSLKSLLKQNAKGFKVVGYTVKQGYSNGLDITSKK
jgi:hypothetical protein